ncbi:hypothetical protein ACQPXM_21795 [Kribbella sp. CA-253562]|uniref:hypothetical protein n=1 Tax=Kribbella sp. CA-253562 TaxID=3239942 RepID=UPI003D8B6DA7
MTTKLDPPPVPPLSPSQREDLRRQVMSAVDEAPPKHRRWVAPVVAVAAVTAVVTGTLAVTGRPAETAPPAASPTATPSSTPTPPSTPGTAPRSWLPQVDLGPVSAAEATRAANACKLPGVRQVRPLWSRLVALPASRGAQKGVIVLTKSTPGQPGGTYGEGVFACFANGGGAAVRDTDWNRQPTPATGAVLISSVGIVGSEGSGKPSFASFQTLFRVRPEIARIESRAVWPEGHGQWTQGAVASGFAYTHSTAVIPAGQYRATPEGTSNLDQQFRAYDADGKPVPLKP